jgi:hypothetical protein
MVKGKYYPPIIKDKLFYVKILPEMALIDSQGYGLGQCPLRVLKVANQGFPY